MNELIESSSMGDRFRQERGEAPAITVYRELFPRYVPLALLETSITPFRTLIVDEAQDMMTQDILDVVDAHVEGGLEAGRWWIFCDTNNQAAVFGAFDEIALRRLMHFGHILVLPTNRRNTKPVANETTMLTQPKIRAVPVVDGIPVRYVWYENPEDQATTLSRVLKQLLSEDVAPARITVLSPHKAEDSCAASVSDPSIVPLTEQDVSWVSSGKSDRISCCSVSSFKGLENDFIILTDIDNLDSAWWRSVIYVGMSRARIGLFLLLKKSLKPVYEQRLRRWLEEQGASHEDLKGCGV